MYIPALVLDALGDFTIRSYLEASDLSLVQLWCLSI